MKLALRQVLHRFRAWQQNFCSNNPLVSTACTTTAGTIPTFNTATPVGGGTAGTTDAWTLGASAANVVKVNGSAVATGAAQLIHIANVTNPTSVGSFYARIYTYSANSYTGFTGGATSGTIIDFGGMALAITTAINVSATVQETLTFCVSKANPTTGCGGLTAPDLILGTGSPKVLTTAAASGQEDFAYFQVTTNAGGGTIVRMKGDYLRNGSNTIVPTVSSALFTITAGTANFGMRIGTASGTDFSSATVTADANYSSLTQYGWEQAVINATYGDQIASVSASSDSWAKINFGATVSATTPAGQYTAIENLIATGTY